MQTAISIKELSVQDTELMKDVEYLFLDLYDYLKSRQLALPLIENGEKLWMESIKNTLGKYSTLSVALIDHKVVGFSFGMVKYLPDYLGGKKVGTIPYFFIQSEYRNQQIGTQLVENLCRWFALQKVSSIEVQVAAINPNAEEFWKQMGFEHELKQLRKFV